MTHHIPPGRYTIRVTHVDVAADRYHMTCETVGREPTVLHFTTPVHPVVGAHLIYDGPKRARIHRIKL